MSDFIDYLTKEKQRSEKTLRAYLTAHLARFSGIDQTFDEFLQNFEPYLLTGGKWARALLSRLAFDLSGGKSSQGNMVLGSLVMEVFHRFLLSHDDIIDQDLTRHGIDTLEAVYQKEQQRLKGTHPTDNYAEGMAIIGGDVIHSLAIQLVLDSGFSERIQLRVIQGLHDCVMETVAGWRLETLLKQYALKEVSKTDVLKAMKLVSAQYSVIWPLRIGQLFAGAQLGDYMPELESFGLNLGMAFQLQDDLLALTGEQAITGKPVGSDLRESKKSLVILRAYTEASKTDKAYLESAMGMPATPAVFKQVKSILGDTGAIEWSRMESKKYSWRALASLDEIEVKAKISQISRLRELCLFLSDRAY